MLTVLESQVLSAILNSDYQDGEDPVNHRVWYLEESDVDMKLGQLSGAISSCVKKDYVGVHKEGNDSTIWITQKGFNIYKEQ